MEVIKLYSNFNKYVLKYVLYISLRLWVPVTPRVADEGVGLQVWMLAANILNKESWTADKSGPQA